MFYRRLRAPKTRCQSEWLIRDGSGQEYKPEDYLAAFAAFREGKRRPQIEAIGILLDRPQDWSTEALTELRDKLTTAPERFTDREPPEGP